MTERQVELWSYLATKRAIDLAEMQATLTANAVARTLFGTK